MNRNMQSGRSMIEMLGVLAIIGVLSVGSLGLVSYLFTSQKEASLISDIADAARLAKKMACQYDDAYKTYTLYLYKSNAYPENWAYNVTKNQYEGLLDTVYRLEGNRKMFYIVAEGLTEDLCMKIATKEWGTLNTSGLVGLAITTADLTGYFPTCLTSCEERADGVLSNGRNYPMGLDKAATYCSGNNNTIQLWYKGCY